MRNDVVSPRARGLILGLTALHGWLAPLPDSVGAVFLLLLAVGAWLAWSGRGLPWWVAIVAAGVSGGWVLWTSAPWWWRPGVWAAVPALAAAAFLLGPGRPLALVWAYLANMILLGVLVLASAHEWSPAAIVVDVLVWLLALQFAYHPPTVPLRWGAALANILRLFLPVGLAVAAFSALLPSRDETSAVSGFTGRGILEAGAFGRVRLSDRPVFKAFWPPDGPPPPAAGQLYWRGDVLEGNAGFTWRRLRPMTVAAPVPAVPRLEILDPMLTRAPQLEPSEPVASVLAEADRAMLLEVPPAVSEDSEVQRFLQPLDPMPVPAALQHMHERFASGGFRYSLRPGRLRRLDLGRFLGTTKVGYCEHYAAAAANLLRTQGIPSRVVVGFRGGSWNPWTRTLTVRGLHAHAWVEAWDGQASAWRRFDPTDAVTNELALRDEAAWDPRQWPWTEWMGKRWEAIWEEFQQTGWAMAGAVAVLTAGVGGLGWWLRARHWRKQHPARRALRRLERRAHGAGLKRQPGETPMAWMQRMATARPERAPWWREAAAEYRRLAYERPPASGQARGRLMRKIVPASAVETKETVPPR